jgi:PPK2 family polyphosphate:nucleotide phosphotransferase
MPLTIRVDQPQPVTLAACSTSGDPDLNRATGEKRLEALREELAELQDWLFAAARHSLLIVLQGRDTSGKDGTIRHVIGAFNPQGTRIANFKAPAEEELSHDFLWRVHRQTPARGEAVTFNRSHYEDVLVVRVHDLAPERVWRPRFEQINAFEELLAAGDTIIAKFFLHISAEEQAERLLAREREAVKGWKLNPGDWRERRHWDEYTAAYEEAIGRCAAPHAPWHVVPADRKWYRNLAIAEALAETLRPYRHEWEESLAERSRQALEEVRRVRAELNEDGDRSQRKKT